MATNFLEMSDEDFLKGPQSPTAETTADSQAQGETSAPVQEQTQEEDTTASETTTTEETKTETTEEVAPAGSTESAADTAATEEENASTEAPQEQKTEGEAAPKETTEKVEAPDYEGFYRQIMTPFKANGKTIELKDPKEAIQLMQMGANYTRKMQELAPHRKVLMMLENNGLLDEGKLSFLIDVDKKDPEAIKKLISDAGIDPLSIDTSAAPAYREGNHRVTDEEAQFQSALQDLQASDSGKETLRVIHTSWDQASKEVLWKSPDILGIMNAQREAGIYDRISTEITRRKTVGAIGPDVPFLQAYRLVGDQMQAANQFADLVQNHTSAPNGQAPTKTAAATPPVVVATRVGAPKPTVVNGDKASAAAPTRTGGPKPKDAPVNYLAMSDEQFMTEMAGRL